ncbi:MAG: hypothetical protein IKY10_04730 [Clostridia bacterium]|nr:hypothetical protein [Clostridia bacterium]
MDKKILVKDLATRVRKYQAKAKLVDIDSKKVADSVFVQYKNETLFNPKYLKVEDYFTIKAFESFLKKYPSLSKEEILEVLKSHKKEFEFLQKFNSKYQNLIEDLKSHGAKHVAINHINNLIYGKNQEEVLSV